eukprot:750_1
MSLLIHNIWLLLIILYGRTVHSVYTVLDFDTELGECVVKECDVMNISADTYDEVYSNCTKSTPFTSKLGQQYLSKDTECSLPCDASQWVWDKSGSYLLGRRSCDCPKCACSVIGETKLIQTTCDLCQCQQHSSYEDHTLSYSCFGIGDPADPSHQSCLPHCVASGYVAREGSYNVDYPWSLFPSVFTAGDVWWFSTESFCVCQNDSTALCSQTYHDIVSNPLLYEPFMRYDNCGHYLRGPCVTDASLWFNPRYVYPSALVCPGCKCDSVGDTAYFTGIAEAGAKDCFECDCILFSGANTGGYQCDLPIYRYIEIEPKSRVCPPVQCVKGAWSSASYWEGDVWWDTIENDPTCQTLCVCQSDGTPLCSTTYSDIVANPVLLNAFKVVCRHTWRTFGDSCMKDATRWFYDTASGNPNDCEYACHSYDHLYCACPSNLANPEKDTWFDLSSGDCKLCHCSHGRTYCRSADEVVRSRLYPRIYPLNSWNDSSCNATLDNIVIRVTNTSDQTSNNTEIRVTNTSDQSTSNNIVTKVNNTFDPITSDDNDAGERTKKDPSSSSNASLIVAIVIAVIVAAVIIWYMIRRRVQQSNDKQFDYQQTHDDRVELETF